MCCPNLGDPPFVTADERYELFLNGERIGRGSKRGTVDAWFYGTYELTLEPGPHVIVARVWCLGTRAPFAQLSLRPGLPLAAEGPVHNLLSTGVAAWEAKALEGYAFVDPAPAWGTGANVRSDGGRYPWDVERGAGNGWHPVERLEFGRPVCGDRGPHRCPAPDHRPHRFPRDTVSAGDATLVRGERSSLLAGRPDSCPGVRMCVHETYMDCPRYEQLIHTATPASKRSPPMSVMTGEDRLPRKALHLFDRSRRPVVGRHSARLRLSGGEIDRRSMP